jgi:signal peptidase I
MFAIRIFIAEPFVVSGSSMVPNFHNREYLVVDKISYRFHEPERGDVIIFRYPKDTSQYFIKRIIGLPGEKVQIVDGGRVKVYNSQHPDGALIDEPYLPSNGISFGKEDIVALGSDEYFVMGDNRPASLDSRSFGPVQRQTIVGRAGVRAWPVHRARTFPTPEIPLLTPTR